MAKMYDEKVTAYRMTAKYSDFDGDLQEWKDAFYELWRMEMTWSCTHDIKVIEGHNGVFVSLLVRKAYKENVKSFMESKGYRNITVSEKNVGLVCPFERADLVFDDIEMLEFDY